MPKINKWLYLWVVQEYTGNQYGWEDVCASETYKEARADLKSYRENMRGYAHRLIQRRELNPEFVGE